jgi:hypothetical protein
MSLSLQDLADNSVSDRNFRKLAQLVIDTGGKDIGLRWGTGTAVFTAAVFTPTVTIAHGLGKTPVVAFTQTQSGLIDYAVTGFTATNLSVVGFSTNNVAVTATLSFYWIVVG